jgi:molecular chaperone GrpE
MMTNKEKQDNNSQPNNQDIIKLGEQLKKDLEEKQKIIEDYESSLVRLQADFENFIKRTQKEKEDFAKYSASKVIIKLLNIIDDFERTIQLLEKSNNPEIKAGIEMVHKQFHKILQEEGVKPMPCKGKKFDPYCHEIIDMVEHESDEGTVVEELQKGYHIHDKVLRTAKVRVSRGKQKQGAK